MICRPKGRGQRKKNVFFRALPELPKPSPYLPPLYCLFFRRGDHVRDFYLSKKTVQKIRARLNPPQIRAMPELKRFFSFDVFPKAAPWC